MKTNYRSKEVFLKSYNQNIFITYLYELIET